MLESFLLIFASIFLAQMGDKTQLITLIMATKTKKHFLLFLAIMTGFLAGVSLAVFVGAGVSQLVPHKILKIISAIVFVILGVLLLFKKKEENPHLKKLNIGNQFITTAFIIFLADFGDKTQIALALFAAANPPLLVLNAGMLALGLVTALTIYFASIITSKLKPHIIEKAAGVLFILIGLLLFF